MTTAKTLLLALSCCTLMASPAGAWDAYGHRLIATVALDGMTNAPDWLKEPQARASVIDDAVVPDRWRSTHLDQLTHLNNPDHYLDVEDLDAYGLTLKTLPTLRYEFVKQMVLAREKAGDSFKGRPVNPARDTMKTEELPGFVPYAILEQYGKLESAFTVVRALEKLNDPARAGQLAAAKENAEYNMGILAHFVGDGAQPLHTTKHHHGWKGDNPKGYTTDNGFHSYIDGRVLTLHHITAADVAPLCDYKLSVERRSPWNDVIGYLGVTYSTVEPLYELQKAGDLEKDAGKQFIEKRLAAGASMLSALYRAAWDAAEPTEKEVNEFRKWDGADAATTPKAPPAK